MMKIIKRNGEYPNIERLKQWILASVYIPIPSLSSQDGRSATITAPSGPAQQRALQNSLRDSELWLGRKQVIFQFRRFRQKFRYNEDLHLTSKSPLTKDVWEKGWKTRCFQGSMMFCCWELATCKDSLQYLTFNISLKVPVALESIHVDCTTRT